MARAVAECRTRTHERIVPLPDGERVGCELVPGVGFVGVGDHHGGLDSTILLNGDRPFNLADLLYVVAHEGHPGHIAEMVLKEIHLADNILAPRGIRPDGSDFAAIHRARNALFGVQHTRTSPPTTTAGGYSTSRLDSADLARRLLTEQVLPAELALTA